MSYKVTNEAGEEIDVYSQEELDAALAEKTAAETERLEAEKQEALETLQAELAVKEEALQKLQDKDFNFTKLRNQSGKVTDETAKALQDQIAALNEKVELVAAQPKNDVKADFIKLHVGENKEEVDKFEYYYKKLGADATNKEDVLKASQEALALTRGGNVQPDMASGILSVGASGNYRNSAPTVVSDEAKAIGRELGVTEDDRKKYGKK